jgi:hypothetical protein
MQELGNLLESKGPGRGGGEQGGSAGRGPEGQVSGHHLPRGVPGKTSIGRQHRATAGGAVSRQLPTRLHPHLHPASWLLP